MLLMDHSVSCLQCFTQESTVRALGNSSVSTFVFVFKKLDARSEASQVGASSPWLGGASMPVMPLCHSAALPCLRCKGPVRDRGCGHREEQRTGQTRGMHRMKPHCTSFFAFTFASGASESCLCTPPSVLIIFTLGQDWRAECDLVFFLLHLECAN